MSYCIQNQVKIHPRSGKSENLFAMSMLANSPRALNNFQMENPNLNPNEEYCQLRWQVVAILSFFPLFFTFCTIQLRICNALFVVNKIKPRYIIKSPSLGWLYVFSSFPPPPPQWLLLLTSKPFQLNLKYLRQRKYRSWKMYWMTFWWPWPKVTAVTLINKKLLVCRIKWEPLNQSLLNFVAISLWSCLSRD